MSCHKSETEIQYDAIFQALADERRREILRILDHRAASVDGKELAFLLVAAEQQKSMLAVTDEELDEVRADLWHVQLPVLEAAGLVSGDEASETVVMTDHPALTDPKVTTILQTDAADWDEILASLADERRRILLTALYGTERPVDRTELATDVAGKVRDGDMASTVQAVLHQIHHVHLPKLEAAGLITYDVQQKTVTYEGHPDIDEEWLVAGSADTPRAVFSNAHQSADS
jgi:DNA-binding transcriptional ArsR family regulator